MLKDTIKSGDWKGEKHVPVIEYTREGDLVRIEVSVGKEIPHPNTPEHHIAWIELYFHPEGENFPIMVGRVAFTSHGDPLTEPRAVFFLKTTKKGKLYALSYCNIHGLWENEVTLE
ncbi:class II SORL domain-containing protein [Pyrococcus sp. ST04]|uniref:class II SORL domain-containing protein n=1 Tax=Pyrococcus sp. ST04 TaxID=1183377 RepID=UPI0002605C5A|nr:desulfoferrodoxin family protein [Pyrococcus sp. ST04]AFK22974.1 superoxide reductase [Pyrococcus sp. ST04]